MTYVLPIPGTAGLQDDPDPGRPRNWWRAGSPLVAQVLTPAGLQWLHPEDPFVWSTDLGGLRFWRRWPGCRSMTDKRDWIAGGKAFRWWRTAKGVPLEHMNLIVHSHALQIVLYAAAEWHEPLFVNRMISIGSPLRKDVMRDVGDAALSRIGAWLHVTDARFDLVQTLGRFGDGGFGSAALPANVEVLQLLHVDHSELLCNPRVFPMWSGHGLLAFLQGTWEGV